LDKQLTVTILVGKPGSGKSTYANEEFLKRSVIIVNQDTLGSRKMCLKLMEKALKDNTDVIVDRTNINSKQRSYFIELAQKYKADRIECIEFKSSNEECIKRIQNRKNHKTITNDFSLDKITEIVLKFDKDYEEPLLSQGFISHIIFHTDCIERENLKGSRS
jgi:predicted kinase